MNAQWDKTQTPLPAATLGNFADACIALDASWDDSALNQHAERLARLTGSDLVLLYEAVRDSKALTLSAHWGLSAESESQYASLGRDQTIGAGGLRAAANDAAPLSYHPRTQDLQALGIRAFWSYPLWSDGRLIGQICFGSRDWDHYHDDALSIFAATTRQIARSFERRQSIEDSRAISLRAEASDLIADRKRQEFIAVLAHELRNPIAPIRSGLDLLASDRLDVDVRRSTTDMMQRQISHLVRLIDDLLDTVRLDTGKLQIHKQPTLLKDVILSGIESVRPALQAKALALALDDDAADVVVVADPVRLSQAFANILSANVRHTPERGVITVSVKREGSRLEVTFEDEGPGTSPGGIEKAFDLFGTSAAHKSDDGLGIGLALVKGLIELNEGTVTMGTRAARNGDIYTVELEAAPIDPSSMNDPDAAATKAWSSRRVLVVDDNRDAAETLGLLLELDGCTVRLAHDGPGAVEQAHEFQPDVIFLDIGLPGYDGNEAARRIRADGGIVRPHIIALTGWGAPTDRATSLAAGVDVHLVKPISLDILRKAIRDSAKHGHH